ncbi:SDR family oxidoreductase [Kamptonema cortianum]|nr:SDR family oxidoreductase [Kamptonema cortianum]MDL5052856.1 SDR family oxidoreductase [Oscillatoria laete-virens NRMC-F 0139]
MTQAHEKEHRNHLDEEMAHMAQPGAVGLGAVEQEAVPPSSSRDASETATQPVEAQPLITPPPQEQDRQPGIEQEMTPAPRFLNEHYAGSGKLEGKVAIITGGDSGIGRAVAVLFAREGADIAIVYLDEDEDAAETERHVLAEGRRCLLIRGDIAEETFCQEAVERTLNEFGQIDIVVNNAAVQYPQESILDITEEQLDRTFRVNVYSQFFMVRAALPYLKPGSSIINTSSVTAYQGSEQLLDYATTKSANIGFTRSLSNMLVKQGIRVNAVAPGPIWTPLIPASFDAERVAEHGEETPMERVGQPEEVAPCYVFLASRDSSYMTGQVLHPNGGRIVNG